MDPELKRLLEENHALAKDNHRLLRAVRRHQLLETFGKYVFWLIVIGLTFYSYLAYLKPLADKFSVSGASSGGLTLPSSASLQNLINSYKAGQ